MGKVARHFEKCRAYITSQAQRREEAGEESAVGGPALTLSRETGAGAVTFADNLAQYLNEKTADAECQWTVFDKNLVRQVLEDHDLPQRLERLMPEDRPRHLEDVVGDMLGLRPPDFELVKRTEETIHRLAKMGHCILVGRGANIITQDLPNVLHVRMTGSLEKRVAHCMDYYGISQDKARELIQTQDRGRRRYLLAYYDKEIDDPANYHLVVNVDLFSNEELMGLMGALIASKARQG